MGLMPAKGKPRVVCHSEVLSPKVEHNKEKRRVPVSDVTRLFLRRPRRDPDARSSVPPLLPYSVVTRFTARERLWQK